MQQQDDGSIARAGLAVEQLESVEVCECDTGRRERMAR